jgi:YfiH family protein
MNLRISVPDKEWQLIARGGLRFYVFDPSPGIEILFTTRRSGDNDLDHNLDIKDQLISLGLDDRLVTMNQIHSDHVVRVDRPGRIDADGCFSACSRLALSVRVADCVPVFLWSLEDALVGVVHAGWRGTLAKIALRFVEKVESEVGVPPHRLYYSLGPSIGSCCYAVGDEVVTAFRESWPGADRFFTRDMGGCYLDLRAANRFLLNSVGAVEGASLNLCTSCEHRKFYSYRREPGEGRNWGIIVRRSSR